MFGLFYYFSVRIHTQTTQIFMANIPQKIQTRITEGLKRFQPIVESAKIRDVSESDTVVMLTGILSDILGYDKYVDITTEFAIRGTYCDLAIKIDSKLACCWKQKRLGSN